jgi:CheY-like chemotaxis protein
MARRADEYILIVEDDDETAHGVADVLRIFGYQSRLAGNGKVALEMLRSAPHEYCIVLLDIMMPVMDGWTFLDQHRADATLSQIPVIIVSAVLNAAARSAATLAVEVLPKPVDTARLRMSIARYCCRGAA